MARFRKTKKIRQNNEKKYQRRLRENKIFSYSRDYFLGFKLSKSNHNQLWLWDSLVDVSGI